MPHIGITILAIAFSVEAVRLSNTAGLMVTADEMDAVRIPELKADE